MRPIGLLSVVADPDGVAPYGTGLRIAALIPSGLVALVEFGPAFGLKLAVVLLIALAWEGLFARFAGRDMFWGGCVAALLLVTLAPVEATPYQLAIAISLAVILGELIFGGSGYGIFSTGALALAILSVSFSGLEAQPPSAAVVGVALPGAAVLLWTGLVDWRILAGFSISLAAGSVITGGIEVPWILPIAFGAVFLMADCFGAPATLPARWFFGGLVGVLLLYLWSGHGAGGTFTPFIFAVVLGNIFSPLLDRLVLLADDLRRGGRHV